MCYQFVCECINVALMNYNFIPVLVTYEYHCWEIEEDRNWLNDKILLFKYIIGSLQLHEVWYKDQFIARSIQPKKL